MKIEIAKYERMSERGSSLLRLMQNGETPLLDLFVRESIQNSLDAALPGNGFVDVKFRTGTFNSMELAPVFEGIRENFFKKHENQSNFLSISDKNTRGLTGPLHYFDVKDDDYGNLLKLVYEINMPQSKEGSGGSWGLGKTIYFRLGIGLVLYYSRIQLESGEYQHRLAASLVEDESKEDAILDYPDADVNLRRGIAWWGQQRDSGTEPVTDSNEIKSILSLFGLSLYAGNETGTTIIIPFINENSLLQNIISQDLEDSPQTKPFWITSIDNYLNMSIQRWYAPRLANTNYNHGRWLRCRINNSSIGKGDFVPFYSLIQSLYNATQFVKSPQPLSNKNIIVEDISLRNEFLKSGTAGQVAFIKADASLLQMLPPDNYSNPFKHLNRYDIGGENNPPILAYTRKPGMIVNYETTGMWTDGIPKTAKNEFIVGLFVLHSDNQLKNTDSNMSLEEYIRKGEKADHTSWHDWIGESKRSIVSKIVRQTANKVGKQFVIEEKISTTRNIGLSKALADILLPPENFGQRPISTKSIKSSEGSIRMPRKLSFSILGNPVYYYVNHKRIAEIKFEAGWNKKDPNYILSSIVKTESSDIYADQWEAKENFNTPFPVQIEEFKVSNLTIGKNRFNVSLDDFSVSPNQRYAEIYNVNIELRQSLVFKIEHSVEILSTHDEPGRIEGTIKVSINEKTIMPGLGVFSLGGSK